MRIPSHQIREMWHSLHSSGHYHVVEGLGLHSFSLLSVALPMLFQLLIKVSHVVHLQLVSLLLQYASPEFLLLMARGDPEPPRRCHPGGLTVLLAAHISSNPLVPSPRLLKLPVRIPSTMVNSLRPSDRDLVSSNRKTPHLRCLRTRLRQRFWAPVMEAVRVVCLIEDMALGSTSWKCSYRREILWASCPA